MIKWRSSAAYRIAFASFIAFTIGLALLGAVVFEAMHFAFLRQLDSMISDEAETIVDEYRVGGSRELAEAVSEREMSKSPTRLLYAVFSPDGKRILGSLRSARPKLGVHDITFIDQSEGPDTARGIGIDLSPRERLLVAADREWIERIDETVILAFGFAFLTACVLAFAGALVLGGYLSRRLRAISRGAEAIIGGDIRTRMIVTNVHDEFDNVAVTLNRMLDRIEGLVENLRQVSSDVAHDLRTPLARLRNHLEGAKLEGSDTGAVVTDAIQQVDEVLSLFAAILRIADVESGEARRFFAFVDLSELVTELAESFLPSIEDEGGVLLSSVEAGVTIQGDRELLAQAVINLLENAQHHTPGGTVIRLTLARSDTAIVLAVVDNGLGVPSVDLARITKRFARLESSRKTAGHGLGLSLVNAVATLHHGRLIIANTGSGLSAALELPLSPKGLAPSDRAG